MIKITALVYCDDGFRVYTLAKKDLLHRVYFLALDRSFMGCKVQYPDKPSGYYDLNFSEITEKEWKRLHDREVLNALLR
jgi:hypothetical protein